MEKLIIFCVLLSGCATPRSYYRAAVKDCMDPPQIETEASTAAKPTRAHCQKRVYEEMARRCKRDEYKYCLK